MFTRQLPIDARAKQGQSRFVGKKFEQVLIRPVEPVLLWQQTQYREDRYRPICEPDRDKRLHLSHGARLVAGREFHMTFTAHHPPQTSIAQSQQQVILLRVDSEGPENM